MIIALLSIPFVLLLRTPRVVPKGPVAVE
jgi:hypothetical protein